MLERLYKLIWFYSEFWLPFEKRRPFTYIMRDIYHKVPLLVITLGAISLYLLGRYTTLVPISVLLSIVIALFVGILLGHLFWTGRYVEGEQENPTYLGENDGKV